MICSGNGRRINNDIHAEFWLRRKIRGSLNGAQTVPARLLDLCTTGRASGKSSSAVGVRRAIYSQHVLRFLTSTAILTNTRKSDGLLIP